MFLNVVYLGYALLGVIWDENLANHWTKLQKSSQNSEGPGFSPFFAANFQIFRNKSGKLGC